MKAIRVREYGGAAVLKLEDVPDPKAGAGELRRDKSAFAISGSVRL